MIPDPPPGPPLRKVGAEERWQFWLWAGATLMAVTSVVAVALEKRERPGLSDRERIERLEQRLESIERAIRE